ncbi:MAG: hypothetical protein WD689_03735 [Gaiellaceae bacterium]
MLDPRLPDIESLEAISQDEEARAIFLRMAAIWRAGRMENFLDQLGADGEVDDETKLQLAELGRDESLLLVVEDYVLNTVRLH